MKINWGTIGIVSMVIGAAMSLISSTANKKEQNEMIDRKLDQKLDKRLGAYQNGTIVVEEDKEDENEEES